MSGEIGLALALAGDLCIINNDMEQPQRKQPERRPFRFFHERPVAGRWNFEETRTMNRSLERLRELAKSLEDEPEVAHSLELLAGNLFTQLAEEVREDPERATDMFAELVGSNREAGRELAYDILSVYHYDLLDRDALEDPAVEVGRWQRLINGTPPGDQREWFCEAATDLIESIRDSDHADLQPFADALRGVVNDNDAS